MSEAWALLPAKYRGAVKRLGHAEPTPVQREALPRALKGESFFAVAPTGTGKTLVYLLPLWRRAEERSARGLVLIPTRELAYQVSQMLSQLDPALREKTVLAIGGQAPAGQEKRLGRKWQVLIGTPGRLLELLDKGAVHPERLGLVVLDEFDKLVSLGFADQARGILERLPGRCQKLFFSATAPDPGLMEALGLDKVPRLEIAETERAMEERFFFLKSSRTKQRLLLDELGRDRGQALVFVSNHEKANHLNGLLKIKGHASRALHGHMDQRRRAEVFQAFREGRFPVLVATDLAARGFDIGRISLIVNYDLPRNFKEYVHRVGRTARAGRAGRSVSFAGPGEYLALRNIERGFPGPLPVHPDYAQRDRWFENARRLHEAGVRAEQRAESIRREQGLTAKQELGRRPRFRNPARRSA